MPATSTQQLADLGSTTVIVHPLVLLSVADHHARAAARATNKRVVGVLLGQDHGKTVNVANSFAIPFEEDEKDSKTWFLDHNYIEGMWQMFKKVNARERMIGWYHTGPKLRGSDQEINDLFKRFIPRPVMVIIDVRQQEVGIPTNAYFAVEEIKDDGTETRKTFFHVPSAIEAEEAEEIGVEHLLRDIKDSTTTTLTTRVAEQLSSLRGLTSRISEIRDYLRAIANSQSTVTPFDSASTLASTSTAIPHPQPSPNPLPINHQVIYHLQDALNLLPDLDEQKLTSAFTTNTNDQLLVIYLSALVRSVIALERLVENKAQNGVAELEDGPSGGAAGEKATKKGGKVQPNGLVKDGKEGEEADGKGSKSSEK